MGRSQAKIHPFSLPPTSSENNAPRSTSGIDLSASQQEQVAAQSSGSDAGQYVQFAYIDEPPLSLDFPLLSSSSKLIGSVNRNFSGFACEIFTDRGVYALRMDAAGLEEEASRRHIISGRAQADREYKDVAGRDKSEMGMTLDQRAVMLATGVTVGYDYFSRHSADAPERMAMRASIHVGRAVEGGAAEGALVSGAGGAASEAAEGAVGAREGVITGAGSTAAYEAMQRGMGGSRYGAQPPRPGQAPVDDASPQAPQQGGNESWGQQGTSPDGWGGQGEGASRGEEVWGQDGNNPWSGKGGEEGGGAGGEGSGGGGRGEGGGGSFWDGF
jgi:Scramblase